MYSIVKAMHTLATELGVQFFFEHDVKEIYIEKNAAKKITAMHNGQEVPFDADVVIGGADYHFIENKLLSPKYQSYTKEYWNRRLMAPGCLIYYVGLNKKLRNILHHSLFFDASFELHGKEIYETKKWPEDPLFYMCATSVTDKTVAPEGFENLFFLIPVAAGLTNDTEELREHYFKKIIERVEAKIGENVSDHIIFKKTYSNNDFINDYNAFKGNAYGLANTLSQTAILKPKIRNQKLKNLFYAGQLTVPGPGVPPSIISGKIAAGLLNKYLQKRKDEIVI
jgi:phytoene desaturase